MLSRRATIRFMLALLIGLGLTSGASGKILCFAESHTAVEDASEASQDCNSNCGNCVDVPLKMDIRLKLEVDSVQKRDKDVLQNSKFLSSRKCELFQYQAKIILSLPRDNQVISPTLLGLKTIVLLN